MSNAKQDSDPETQPVGSAHVPAVPGEPGVPRLIRLLFPSAYVRTVIEPAWFDLVGDHYDTVGGAVPIPRLRRFSFIVVNFRAGAIAWIFSHFPRRAVLGISILFFLVLAVINGVFEPDSIEMYDP